MDQAISVLNNAGSKKKEIDTDDAFGQHVALTLRKVADGGNKEFAKLQIQEILLKSNSAFLGYLPKCRKS